MSTIELWGGLECTINRVRQNYFNQLIRTGHWNRPEDIKRFADLGLKTLRYPFLWEAFCPDGNIKNISWDWAEERLRLLQQCHIRPIAGLLHHGSGPLNTSLCDPDFPQKFAEYAFEFAKRFPTVEDYTPINEPLTTARFSALYGIWYPHEKNEASFALAIFNQCKATVLAMEAIRYVNPKARLIQTDDLGYITSTPHLAYQAAFENERRWLTFDLLCGKINHNSVIWKRLLSGVTAKQLEFFHTHPCPPNIIGLNYYLASDRFLDENIEKYPPDLHGGNGRDVYVDRMSAHAHESHINGHVRVLTSAWERYHLPVAITEVHIDSSREEQMRWFKESWDAVHTAKQNGVDVRALTAWSLLGCYDWNNLVTTSAGYYEPGAFDVRGDTPRPTALAGMIKSLTQGQSYMHPVLENAGWWRRSCRVLTRKDRHEYIKTHKEFNSDPAKPILITGATGTLGVAFARICEYRALSYRLLSRHQMDIADPFSVDKNLNMLEPWAVVNTAGYVRVAEAEKESHQCYRENTTGAEILAKACEARGIPLLTFSTDLVFDGSGEGYYEHDLVSPDNVYGKSKAEAERKVLKVCTKALVIRTSSFFGPWDEHNFLTIALRSWAEGKPVSASKNIIITPTYVPDLVHTCLDLLIDGEKGIWHVTNGEALSWCDFVHRLAVMMQVPSSLINAHEAAPKNLALRSQKGNLLPSLQGSLERYLEETECIFKEKLINKNLP
jgi:dTDP-4-dehydrorhamnose reductase